MSGIFSFTIKDICCNVDIDELRRTVIPNCSITKITIQVRAGTLEAELQRWADCAHLSGAAARLVSSRFTE